MLDDLRRLLKTVQLPVPPSKNLWLGLRHFLLELVALLTQPVDFVEHPLQQASAEAAGIPAR